MWVALILLILVDGSEVKIVKEDLSSRRECVEYLENYTKKIYNTNTALKEVEDGEEKLVEKLYLSCIINPTIKI